MSYTTNLSKKKDAVSVRLIRLLARHFIRYGWAWAIGVTTAIVGIHADMWEFWIIIIPNAILVNIAIEYNN